MLSNNYKRVLTGIKMTVPTNGFKWAFFEGEVTLCQQDKTGVKNPMNKYDMYFEVANLRLGRNGDKPLG